MVEQKIILRIKELIQLGDRLLRTKHGDGYPTFVDTQMFFQFRAESLSFLKNVFQETHPIYTEFLTKCKISQFYEAEVGVSILRAAETEIVGGWLTTVKDFISAEIFSDFMEMAEYLLSQKYKDPAAVILGSVLEEHLRGLCSRNGIETQSDNNKPQFKKAESINSELYKSNIYNKLDSKSITMWLDLRNKAAHGHYNDYNIDQVNLMHQGILEFMVRVK